MVSEMSASVSPRAILYSAYNGTGTATAAKVSSMAHAAMMALLRFFAFDASQISVMSLLVIAGSSRCIGAASRRLRPGSDGLFAICYR